MNNILPNLHSNGCTITCVKQIKFLGIIIDENLCCKFHLSSVRDKISKDIAILKLSFYFMPQDCLLYIYNAFILSYFNYCIIIWGNAHKKYLNLLLILLKHAIRLICKASFADHCAPLAKQCNIFFVHDLFTFVYYKYMYNIYHNRVANNHNCFRSISNVHVKSTRNVGCNLYVYPASTSLRRNLLMHAGVMLWINLHSNIKLLKYGAFISHIKITIFSEYI